MWVSKMKFTLENGREFDRGDVKGKAYNSKMRILDTDRLYFVIKGKGEFIINSEVIPVKETDVVIIPKNTPYEYRGIMKCFLVNSPAFDRSKEIIMEKITSSDIVKFTNAKIVDIAEE